MFLVERAGENMSIASGDQQFIFLRTDSLCSTAKKNSHPNLLRGENQSWTIEKEPFQESGNWSSAPYLIPLSARCGGRGLVFRSPDCIGRLFWMFFFYFLLCRTWEHTSTTDITTTTPPFTFILSTAWPSPSRASGPPFCTARRFTFTFPSPPTGRAPRTASSGCWSTRKKSSKPPMWSCSFRKTGPMLVSPLDGLIDWLI